MTRKPTAKRPKKRDVEKNGINVYSLTEQEIATIEEAANKTRVSRSKYVGDAALKQAQKDIGQ